MLAGRAELGDDVPHADEAHVRRGQLLADVVGEVDGQRRAAAEADDVDVEVAGRQVVRHPAARVVQARTAADAEGFRDLLTHAGVRADADPLEIQAAPLGLGVGVLQRILVGVEEVQDVAVPLRAFAILVAGAVECVQCHEIRSASVFS